VISLNALPAQVWAVSGEIRGVKFIVPATKDRIMKTPVGSLVSYEEIDSLKSQIANLPLVPRTAIVSHLTILRLQFLVDLTYNSCAIEGNHLNPEETRSVIIEDTAIAEKPVKDHLEVIGHSNATQYVDHLVDTNAALTEEAIKHIHSHLLLDKPWSRGVFRDDDICVSGSNRVFPSPELVPPMICELLASHEASALHPIAEAARFHLEFECIHPFDDGNGRTGRLLLNWMLMRRGYPPIIIPFSERPRYIDCFHVYEQGGDTTPLETMVAESMRTTMGRIRAIYAKAEGELARRAAKGHKFISMVDPIGPTDLLRLGATI